jgi:hypothetical protein
MIAEILARRGVNTSPTAVGRFCRKHLTEEEVAKGKADLRGVQSSPSAGVPTPRATLADFDDLLASARRKFEVLLDGRLNGVAAAAASIEKSRTQLAEMRAVSHERPPLLAKQLEMELQVPATKVLQRMKELEMQLSALLVATRGALAYAERRLLFAAWAVGLITGAIGFWLLSPR